MPHDARGIVDVAESRRGYGDPSSSFVGNDQIWATVATQRAFLNNTDTPRCLGSTARAIYSDVTRNKLDEMDEIHEMQEIHEMEKVNEMDDTYDMEEMDKTDKIEDMDDMDDTKLAL